MHYLTDSCRGVETGRVIGKGRKGGRRRVESWGKGARVRGVDGEVRTRKGKEGAGKAIGNFEEGRA